MSQDTGYEGETWELKEVNEDIEDDNIVGQMIDTGKEALRNFFAIIVCIAVLAGIITFYFPEITNLLSFVNVLIFSSFIFTAIAFWGSHNKKKIPEILEFKEPTFPKE